jgi:hypothetical protein
MFGIRRITNDYVECIDASDEYDLTEGKYYRLVEDARAARMDCIRIVDDSDCSALHPAELFRPVGPGEDRA